MHGWKHNIATFAAATTPEKFVGLQKIHLDSSSRISNQGLINEAKIC